jgi:hypothetical protein
MHLEAYFFCALQEKAPTRLDLLELLLHGI